MTLDPNKEVLPLIGSKEGIGHISFCLIDPGDIALVPDPGYPVLVGCTFTQNRTLDPNALGGGLYNLAGAPSISNSVFWGNTDSSGVVESGQIHDEPGQVTTVLYSVIQGLDVYANEGNIDEDPLFVDPDEGDYHLTEDSPCIDVFI